MTLGVYVFECLGVYVGEVELNHKGTKSTKVTQRIYSSL